jgi:hypothetical protein
MALIMAVLPAARVYVGITLKKIMDVGLLKKILA